MPVSLSIDGNISRLICKVKGQIQGPIRDFGQEGQQSFDPRRGEGALSTKKKLLKN